LCFSLPFDRLKTFRWLLFPHIVFGILQDDKEISTSCADSLLVFNDDLESLQMLVDTYDMRMRDLPLWRENKIFLLFWWENPKNIFYFLYFQHTSSYGFIILPLGTR